MAQNFLDEPYVVTTILNRVFNDQSPSYAVYNNQIAMAAANGVQAFALSFGAAHAGRTEEQLSTGLLNNLGLLPNAGLQTALRDYLEMVGKANVGIVALQLGQILSGLEHATGDQAVFNAAAVAWNKELVASYNFSSNPANTGIGPPVLDDDFVTGVTLVLTSGDDAISLTAPEAKFKSTGNNDTILAPTSGLLSSSDVVDGAGGMDILRATLATGASVAPVLHSIEKVYITAGAGAQFSAAGTTGLTELWVNAAEASTTFSGVSLETMVGIQNSVAGGTLAVNFTGASGPADSAHIVLADATGHDEIIVANIEFLTVRSTAGTVAATTANQAKISAAQAQGIVILGDQALTTTVTGAQVAGVDATALTKALGLTLAGTNGVVVSLNAQAAHKINLGAGADTVKIMGLAGAEAKDINLSTSATLAASAIEVAGFASGTDSIQLDGAKGTVKAAAAAAELASIAASASLLDATALAATTAGANKAIAFRYGADSYILVNDSVVALGANDSLVKLTGVTALADASWTSA
ncbi:bluetail domain-containing putative surface protein [Acidovorax sp. A1169]|uniref:bluetail domain-containing putative surface protein n=1 Tax=Acidovorax sp. A1169 TaxID=3059524 RepID=UPI002737F797|nr:bluetail domain-containing putative surface protein [Acidovorax sp. A1169]MDP4077783.1 bluetail domain-containing putative surface protein [Acidovorax sp. A1169]